MTEEQMLLFREHALGILESGTMDFLKERRQLSGQKPKASAMVTAFTIGLVTLVAPFAEALPQDPNVVSGTATFETPDSQTLQITASDQSIVEFKSFDIKDNESVIYVLPGSSSATLSRVVGGKSSEILGFLSANGTLVFINPAGIAFGSAARVEVGGLIASTLPLNNADFLAGQYRFDGSQQASLAAITNEGSITAQSGRFAVLVGGAVVNTGTITVPVGTVVLASGQVVTVGISGDNQVAIAIDIEVASTVVDAKGKPITTQISNTGTVTAEGGHVVMTAKAAAGLFDLAINQEGVVRADRLVAGKNGVIELVATGPVQNRGSMSAESGKITVTTSEDLSLGGTATAKNGTVTMTAGKDLTVVASTSTAGTTTLRADKNLKVNANLTNDAGSLTLAADADLDGQGSYLQAAGTTVATTTFGDITIASSGASTLASVNSAGSLTLKQAGAAATYTQHAGSSVKTAGGLTIEPGVTLQAGTTLYEVGRDWINLGVFDPGTSSVWLTGPDPATVKGSTIFYDFGSKQPGKPINFETGTLQEILGTTTFRGDFGNLLLMRSTMPGQQFGLLPRGETILQSVDFMDAWIRGPPRASAFSKNSGNNVGLDFSLAGPVWTGAGSTSYWSDTLNWDGGFVPGAFDLVRFTPTPYTLHPSPAVVDPAFSGTIAGL
ncbi:MAG: filamentous hemagglutinin N-terminal domain-containing protein, partial [Chloroflexota bacterium]